jgi:RNA polymerase sigma-70 factor (ECF subfamily)
VDSWNRVHLLQSLVAGYSDIRRRLTRRLGSADLACEVLQETYLRLDRSGDVGVVQRPLDYIFRVALNIAGDRKRAERRRLSYSEVEALYHFANGVLDGESLVEQRLELAALQRAVAALPERQRAILLAVRLEGTPHADLAKRFGISERMVDTDLRQALGYCANELDRVLITRFGTHPPQSPTGSSHDGD